MRTVSELRQRIEQNRVLDDRMDKRDYFGRLWVADYVANADIIADCLDELLGREHEPTCCVIKPDPLHLSVACCCQRTPARPPLATTTPTEDA